MTVCTAVTITKYLDKHKAIVTAHYSVTEIHSLTVVGVTDWIWEKKCLRSVGYLFIPYEISRGTVIIVTNTNSTTGRLKHSSDFESAENFRSSNVVEFEFELRDIANVHC